MKTTLAQNDTFEWIDILSPTEDDLSELSQQYGLHRYTLLDCLEPDHLPKFEELDDFEFIILRVYSPDAKKDARTIQELSNKVAIFFNKKTLITVHRRDFEFIEEVNTRYVATQRCVEVSEIVSKLIWNAIYAYEKPALALAEEIDKYEDIVFLKDIHPNQFKRLYFLKRKASVCKRILLQTQTILNHHRSTERDNVVLQDVRDLHLKLLSMFDQSQEDLTNLSNIFISLSAQKTNDVMKLLTIFSVFFMPITFIAGLYGMNFDNMPELHTPYGYFVTIFVMVAVSVSTFVWFRKKKLL